MAETEHSRDVNQAVAVEIASWQQSGLLHRAGLGDWLMTT